MSDTEAIVVIIVLCIAISVPIVVGAAVLYFCNKRDDNTAFHS